MPVMNSLMNVVRPGQQALSCCTCVLNRLDMLSVCVGLRLLDLLWLRLAPFLRVGSTWALDLLVLVPGGALLWLAVLLGGPLQLPLALLVLVGTLDWTGLVVRWFVGILGVAGAGLFRFGTALLLTLPLLGTRGVLGPGSFPLQGMFPLLRTVWANSLSYL